MSISFTKLGKISFIIFSNKFSISCSSSSPSGNPMIQMLIHLKLSQRFLTLPLIFGFFFLLAVQIECLFLPYVPKSLISFLASSPPLLVPCNFFFISLSVTFISAWVFFMLLKYPISSLSILITNVLNRVSDRLFISSCLILFWSFVLFFHFCHISLSPHLGSLSLFASIY